MWICVIGGLGLVCALMAVQLLLARQALMRGAQLVERTSLTFNLHAIMRSPDARTTLRAHLVDARGEFAAARGDLALWAPLLHHLGPVPLVGGQMAVAPAAANAAYHTADAAINLLDGISPLIPELDRPSPHTALSARILPTLEAQQGHFAAAAGEAERALAELPSRSGNVALDRAASRLRRNLPSLAAAGRWLAVVPMILGERSPGRYLILLQDPRELRATGGFIGATALLTAHGGVLDHSFSSSSLSHEITSVSPPAPEAMYTAEGPWIFRDSNWSPDFPLSARLARWFYGQDTGIWVDGVIAVQDTVLPSMLAASGPVYVPAFGQWVSAANLETLTQQYVNGLYHGPSQSGSKDTQRKQFIGDVFAALLGRLDTLPAARWPALGTVLSRAVADRGVMLYDQRPAVQAAIRSIHAAGRFVPTAGDELAIVDDNRSYNKLNPYVHESAEYTAVIRPDLSVDSTVRIRYDVAPSPAGLEGSGPGFGMWGSKHDYQDFLRVYVPNGAQNISTTGIDLWKPVGAYGFTQVAGRLLVREGQSRTVVMRYRLPANIFSDSNFGRYRLTVLRQPGTDLRAVQVHLLGIGGVKLAGKSNVVHIMPLRADVHLDLPISGAGSPRLTRLPSPIYRDPYLPYSDLHDSRHSL